MCGKRSTNHSKSSGHPCSRATAAHPQCSFPQSEAQTGSRRPTLGTEVATAAGPQLPSTRCMSLAIAAHTSPPPFHEGKHGSLTPGMPPSRKPNEGLTYRQTARSRQLPVPRPPPQRPESPTPSGAAGRGFRAAL